jgi:hypothetical protein
VEFWDSPDVYAATSVYDADAEDYINRVIAADVAAGNSLGLETATKDAYNAFVVACKADGTWGLLDAACILMGARTLAGALVPLKGAAPTSGGIVPLVSGDYDRKEGIRGGPLKILFHNHTMPTGRQNNAHASVYFSTMNTVENRTLIQLGNETSPNIYIVTPGSGPDWLACSCVDRTFNNGNRRNGGSAGFKGVSRNAFNNYTLRSGGTDFGVSATSVAYSSPITGGSVLAADTNGVISWYSFGQALTFLPLESKLGTLGSSISAAF